GGRTTRSDEQNEPTVFETHELQRQSNMSGDRRRSDASVPAWYARPSHQARPATFETWQQAVVLDGIF
ncbi:MAG: hypothetical protein AAFP68_07945, partial [Pseudomonadota bacterium]